VAHVFDFDREALRRRRAITQRYRDGRHQMNPFCQLSSRSRTTNKSFTRPAQMNAMITKVA
jgi:hypothetical protein